MDRPLGELKQVASIRRPRSKASILRGVYGRYIPATIGRQTARFPTAAGRAIRCTGANDRVWSVPAGRFIRSGPTGPVDAARCEGLIVEGSNELSVPVGSLYREILRNSEMSEQADVGLIADLAMALTAGGTIRGLEDCTDLASTGGPGSISTMLVPLMARASGVAVAKIGVPGRPAGAVDALANVHGYRWTSTAEEFDAAMRNSGFAHTAANNQWAPGDAALFRRRQAEGTQRVPPLVVASLLAKKIAAGVRYPGFEVRAARHGNFGSTRDEVRRNASLLCEVAGHLGMRATVFVTDAEHPHQPWIGRGEALAALAIACARHDRVNGMDLGPEGPLAATLLAEHVASCEQMAGALVKVASREGASGSAVGDRAAPPRGVTGALSEHLLAHGSTWRRFDERARAAIAAPREILRAETDGFVRYRMERIRDHLMRANACGARSGRSEEPTFPDRAGAILHAPAAAQVERGDAVLSLRWPSELTAPDASDLFEVTDVPSTSPLQTGEQVQEIIG